VKRNGERDGGGVGDVVDTASGVSLHSISGSRFHWKVTAQEPWHPAAEGKAAKYKDVTGFKSDDHRVPTPHMLGDDEKWHQFMTASYRRKR